ncbi:hypothetical protein ACFX13_002398 [Malus domestica]
MSEKVKGNVSGDHVMLYLHVFFYGSDHVQQFELAMASLMITLRSDAQLEAVDSLDPFSKVLLVATGNKTTGSGIELVSAATAAYIYV